MEKEKNQREYEILVEKIKGNELNREWHEGYENCQEIIVLLKELEKFDELKEYNHKSYFFEKAHENEREKVKKSEKIEQKPEVGEEIADLDQKEEDQPIMEEELPLKDEEDQPLKEEDKILESNDYNQLLRQANLIESRFPHETKQILKKCITIISKDREGFIEKNPKRLKDEAILEKRI